MTTELQRETAKLRKARHAVLNGPELKRHKVLGHHWNFKKAKREKFDKKAGTGVVTGTISHNVRFVDDDQIKYEITFTGRKKNGVLKKPQVEIKIKESKWTMVTGKAVGFVAKWYTEKEEAGKAAEKFSTTIAKKVHGDWRKAANSLVLYLSYVFGEVLGSVVVETPPKPKPAKPRVAGAVRARAIGTTRLRQRTANRN